MIFGSALAPRLLCVSAVAIQDTSRLGAIGGLPRSARSVKVLVTSRMLAPVLPTIGVETQSIGCLLSRIATGVAEQATTSRCAEVPPTQEIHYASSVVMKVIRRVRVLARLWLRNAKNVKAPATQWRNAGTLLFMLS